MSKIINKDIKLSKETEKIYRDYLMLSKNYLPLVFTKAVPSKMIATWTAQKLINNKLTILSDDDFLTYQEEGRQQSIFIFKLYHKGGQYFAEAKTSNPQVNRHQYPLLDLHYMMMNYSPYASEDPLRHFTEIDAVINQVLGPYPELLDLLFPALSELHYERSGSGYQACSIKP